MSVFINLFSTPFIFLRPLFHQTIFLAYHIFFPPFFSLLQLYLSLLRLQHSQNFYYLPNISALNASCLSDLKLFILFQHFLSPCRPSILSSVIFKIYNSDLILSQLYVRLCIYSLIRPISNLTKFSFYISTSILLFFFLYFFYLT